MAFTTTTLTGAVVVNQNSVNVTAATGFAAGLLFKIDDEMFEVQDGYVSGLVIPCLRGREGSATAAHASGANVRVGLATDWAGTAPQTTVSYPSAAKARVLTSISVTGALPLPTPGNDLCVILNGTTIIAATLANPTADMDGCILTICGNGKAAHTVTYTAGLGNVGAAADVLTFKADQTQAVQLIASGGFWNGLGTVAGAATIAGVGIG